jgi:hypothetical protein
MEGSKDEDIKAPLLTRRRNSVRGMRGEFLAQLPEKVRRLVDPEQPSSVDLSLAKDLDDGTCLCHLNFHSF